MLGQEIQQEQSSNRTMKVSILIPCYNAEAYLAQCLDSIKNQTHQNLQIVLVDDGSQDDTLAIAEEYAATDSRIEVYHQENRGVSSARNVLLSKIKGDYFLFVDSDDWIELDMVEFLVSKATEHNADASMCGMFVNNTPLKADFTEYLLSREDCIEKFLFHNELRGSLWNKLVKTSLLHNARFHCGISYGEDALFCWHLLQNVQQVVMTDRQLYHYRMNDASISHSTFGSKKISGHQVWTYLCKETEQLYPEFIDIARARFCVETTLLLRDAAHCGYKEKNNVKMLQNTIKKYWNCLNKVKITSIKMRIYAFLACRSYWLASKI